MIYINIYTMIRERTGLSAPLTHSPMSHLRCRIPSHASTYSYLVDIYAGHERGAPMSYLPVGLCCRQIISVLRRRYLSTLELTSLVQRRTQSMPLVPPSLSPTSHLDTPLRHREGDFLLFIFRPFSPP